MAAPKKKKRKKKSSYWSPAAVTGRVVWGHGGFKGALRRGWRAWTAPQSVAPAKPNPNAGKLKTAGVRQRKDGTWKVKPPQALKPLSVKKRIEQMQNRIATESDRHAKYLKAQAAPRPASQSERVRRKPDGRFNGSRADPTTQERKRDAQVQREYARAMKNAAAAGKRAEQLLGWERPRRSAK